MPTITLRSPTAINPPVRQPIIGLGTWKIKDSSLINILLPAALSTGFRQFDSASVYENEKQFGEALSKEINSGKIKREDVFITSKLWNTQHHEVESACRASLTDWNLKYFDQYLVHLPLAFKQKNGERLTSQRDVNNTPILNHDVTLEDTWKQMEKLVEKELTRSIGVSNFDIERLERILAIAKIPPAVNQDHNIAVVAFSPLGSGKLGLIDNPIVKEVAENEKLTPGQVLIAWSVTRGCIVIPKTSNPERLNENYTWGGEKRLGQDAMNKLGMISKEKRGIKARTCDPIDLWGIPCFEAQE